MRTALAFVTILSLAAVIPSIADLGTAMSARGRQAILAEASLPSPGSRDTAIAENESNGPTRFGRDSAQMAETSVSTPASLNTAV